MFGLVITRWLHWTVSILLASSQFFRLYIVPQKEVAEGRNTQLWRDEFLSRLSRFDHAAWVVAVLSLFAWFASTAWNIIGPDESMDVSLLLTISAQTQVGRVSIARLVILVLLGICLFVLGRSSATKNGYVLRLVAVGLGTVNLMMLALVGHAAATPNPAGSVHLAVDIVHLATTLVWPGGLLFFGLLLRSTMSSPSIDVRLVAAKATRRFSASSLAAVGILSMSGLVTSSFFIHDVSDLWKTTYGQLLTAKVLLFCGMLAFGAQNLLVFKDKLDFESHSEPASGEAGAAGSLFRNVLWELALGTGVILIVAVLGITEPPGH